MITPHPIAIYARYSSERQNPMSVQDQIAVCEARAKAEGWMTVGTFSDEAISGAAVMRPGYQKLRNAVASGKVEIVLAESLDRISRDQEDTANFFKHCRFHDVDIFTLSEGMISELHVGLSSTINAVYLKQLAERTRRGLGKKVEHGRNGGGKSYGYRVPVLSNTLPDTGNLEIDEDQARIVRRIFKEYAAGVSPRKIAIGLNADGIPAARAKSRGENRGDGKWKANAILGNRHRGTGIINNELYIGRRIWNRLRYVKDPQTRKRVSRVNPQDKWIVSEVPELRIVPQALWDRVKVRQEALDAKSAAKDKGDRKHCSGAHAARRPVYLLSGLVRCGRCGGTMNIGGSTPKRYYCSNHREKGPTVCKGIKGITREALEAAVLSGLKDRLMQPAAIEAFVRRYAEHHNALNTDRRDRKASIEREIARVEKEIANILNAIKAGIFTTSTKDELEQLEAEKDRLARQLDKADVAIPDINPNIATLYRTKVEKLVETLNDPATREKAANALRSLVEAVIVDWDEEAKKQTVEIVGDLAALLGLADNKNAASYTEAAPSLKLVAGGGFEPPTFRL